ncbi:MAG: aspartyl/glutamyl-tRNA amidotransferase subunit C [Candidatus Methanoplasma sp.]|jgi:aspartyl-tRNA(Asn)/glutamyl-tRNA(Gln) amidotransferase subunit C|nr:aspartyl/glutamyl-tRNA amidotransferase subunit C [Candidatus Methanoplasma sp.]
MDKEMLKGVARSAHLALGEDELDRYCTDLNGILEGFSIIDDIPGEGAYSLNSVEVADVLRDDVAGIFIDPYELLKDMRTYENYVRGPRLL